MCVCKCVCQCVSKFVSKFVCKCVVCAFACAFVRNARRLADILTFIYVHLSVWRAARRGAQGSALSPLEGFQEDCQEGPRAPPRGKLAHGPSSLSMVALLTRAGCHTRGGTRTRNLLLRREAPYPLGHTSRCIIIAISNCCFCFPRARRRADSAESFATGAAFPECVIIFERGQISLTA